MLERLAAYFLNTYVAEYVGNVVTEQLTIGWMGDVELEKLPLKKNALHKHQLPFDVISGHIGKLKLQIPVTHIKSQPWVIQVDQVYVVLGPSQHDEYDAEEEERKAQGKKRAQLTKLEQQWKEEQRLRSGGGSGWWFLSPFSLSLPSNIITNLQIMVNDVHVRYEESSVLGVTPFSLGLVISSLSVQSTDENWRKEFRSEAEKDYKLMDVVDFSLYWDTDMIGDLEGDPLVLALQQKKAAMATLQNSMSASMMAGYVPSVDVLIRPTGGRVKLIRNRSKDPLKSCDGPRVSLEVDLEEIPVSVREDQWRCLVRSGEESVRRWRRRRWRKWRPIKSISEDVKGWWRFAIMSVLERVRERNRRCSPQFMLHRASQNLAYVALYTQHLALGSVSEIGKKRVEEIEREQSYSELAVLRKLVMNKITQERDLAEAAQQRLESESGSNQRQPGLMQRWLTGWISSSEGTSGLPTSKMQVEEEELMEELGYEASTSDAAKKDSVFLRLSFSLSRGSLSLTTFPASSSLASFSLGPEPLVSLSFSSLCSSVDLKPRVRGATFELSLGSLHLHNDTCSEENAFVELVKPKGELPVGDSNGMDHVDVGFPDKNGMETEALFLMRASLEKRKKINLHVHSSPLDVVYNQSTTNKLLRFLRSPWRRGGVGVGGEVSEGYHQLEAELRSHTTAGIRHRIEELLEGERKASQYQLTVRLDISAPRILIPEDAWNGDTQKHMVILDLGRVTFGSVSDWSEEQEKSFERAMLLGNTNTIATEEDEDEEFATPLSSPPGEMEDVDSAPSLSRPVGGAEVAAALNQGVTSAPSVAQSNNSRCVVDPAPDNAHFSIWATVPTLCFHIDQQKVQSVLLCLRLLTPPTSHSHTPSPTPLLPPKSTHSLYKSALLPEEFLQSDSAVQDSIYLSIYEDPTHQTTGVISEQQPHPLSRQRSCDPRVAKERYQRQRQVALKEIVSAHFSIDSVFLSLSSNEQVITDLTVPGLTLSLRKRPHDILVDLTVQDICVVDRFQNFGPEFELLLCSEGKHLLNLSSPSNKQKFEGNGTRGSIGKPAPSSDVKKTYSSDYTSVTPFRTHLSDIPPLLLPADLAGIGVLSPATDSPTLLSITYQYLTSLSPDHPAMRDIHLGGGGGIDGDDNNDEEVVEEWAWPGKNEPEIHKVSFHCTGIDVMANQETIAELISFCKGALPLDMIERKNREETQREEVFQHEDEMPVTSNPIEMEVEVVFERLGVRLLRRINHRRSPTKGREKPDTSSAHSIASLMLYRLSVDIRRRKETAVLEGQLEGIKITDLTDIGKKYRDILTMGSSSTIQNEFSSCSEDEALPQFLRFSVHISPRSTTSGFSSSNDVNLSVSVPSIHYTHSVNMVQEMEVFVSEFQELARVVMESAVGVAKGLVNEKSLFAERLSNSIGPSSMHQSLFHSTGGHPVIEAVDTPMYYDASEDHLYVDILVQSPVITLPSSLHGDKCLVAYLGEISVKNSFSNLTDSLSASITSLIPERETLLIRINRMSLHATHDESSRELLVASGGKTSQGKWWKVMNETSVVVKIDRKVGEEDIVRPEKTRMQNEDEEANEETDFEIKPPQQWMKIEDESDFGDTKKQAPKVCVGETNNEATTTSSPSSTDIVVSGEICDHLLISLTKEVFDQMRVTLKHGIYKPVRHRKRNKTPNSTSKSTTSSYSSQQSVPKSEQSLMSGDNSTPPQTVAISFSLPRLSLHLKHTISAFEKDLVYISFEDFGVHLNKSESHLMTLDLALKSIVIEDLIQEKESDYRYILASSSRPYTGISPLRSGSSLGLQRLSISPSHLTQLTNPLLPFSNLLTSTPRAPQASLSDSPLRSFTPYNERGKPNYKRSFYEEQQQTQPSNSEGSCATPKSGFTRSVATSPSGFLTPHEGLKMAQSEPSLTNFSEDHEITGSTLREERSAAYSCGSGGNLSSDSVGLLSIRAVFVDKEHPQFSAKYNSVGGHVEVEFSSASVIINLQTWVLLLDYLGIGIPTPPPSPAPSSHLLAEEEDEEEEEERENAQNSSLRDGSSSTLFSPMDSLSSSAWSLNPHSSTSQTLHHPHSLAEGYISKTASSSSQKPSSIADFRLQSVPGKPLSSFSINPLSSLKSSTKLNSGSTSSQHTEGLSIRDTEAAEGNERKCEDESDSVWGVEDKGSMDISLKVKSLTVTFNKPEHPLAQGVVSELVTKVETRRGNLQLSGALGQASVMDLTETGAYYRERFTTTGDPALNFEIFKYGRPDPQLERDFDISAQLNMASVRYLHTMRFLKEVLAFCSHFPQLIDALQRMKAMAQGNWEYSGPDRKARIRLDVALTGPILLIPKHAFSPEIMVGDFGHVRVTNSTRYDGEEGTLTHMNQTSGDEHNSLSTPISERSGLFSQAPPSHNSSFTQLSDTEGDRERVEERLKARSGPCLLDCIQLDLTEVDVFSAHREPSKGERFKIVRQKGKVLKEKGELTLYIERNLFEDFCRDVPDLHIEGTLSAIHVMLDKTQLELVKGLLGMNLGESIEDFEKPSTVIRDPIAAPVAAELWIGFLFRIKFLGVQLEFLQQRQTEVPGSMELSLALFDIQDSEFSFCSRSDQVRTVDFINHAVYGYDTRYNGYEVEAKPSVFSEVLRPRFKTTDNRPIQVEIHVRVSPTRIGATILLNKLRLIGLFDLLLLLKSFVFDSIPDDIDSDVDEVDLVPEPSEREGKLNSHLKSIKQPEPTPQPNKPPREVRVRLSITETDIVVVEDISSASSNAVVLKGTVILKFQSLPHKTLYTSIDALELFSCNLDNEDESALSILDPVTITMEIKPPNDRVSPVVTKKKVRSKKSMFSIGEQQVYAGEAGEGTMQPFEVDFKQLNVRLSYNDLKMFLAIAQSLPPLTSPPSAPPTPTRDKMDSVLESQLLPLGYTKTEIRHQILLHSSDSHGGRENEAIERDKEDKEHEEEMRKEEKGKLEEVHSGREEAEKKFSIGKIELIVKSLSVCLIDDSANRDVPLLDLSVSDIRGIHDPWRKKGEASAVVSSDYYNRHISAWEPVVEPWRLKLFWEKVVQYSTDQDGGQPQDRMYFKLSSPMRLCINVTSSLIQILNITQSNWREDFRGKMRDGSGEEGSTQLEDIRMTSHRTQNPSITRTGSEISHDQSRDLIAMPSRMERGLALLHSVRLVSETRQRSKFVPFLLRNSTGLRLQFATLTSMPSQVYTSSSSSSTTSVYRSTSSVGVSRRVGGAINWMWVEPEAEQPFDFSSPSKHRHQETRSLVVHQLLVKVAGWNHIDIPVSVDKIGVFFREVRPIEAPLETPPQWLVFAISLSDTRKIINIRSSLVLHNTTELTLDVRLESPPSTADVSSTTSYSYTSSRTETVDLPLLQARGYAAIPLHLTEWGIKIRPHGQGLKYSDQHLAWKYSNVRSPSSQIRTCEKIGDGDGEGTPFRFCVSVQREKFPLDSTMPPLPAHTLTILPPLTISNLLPCDVHVYLTNTHLSSKMIRRGKEISIYPVEMDQPVELNAALDGFNSCEGCSVSITTVGLVQGMIVRDDKNRPLRLTITTEILGGSALKVAISCAYWLVNRTSLPLVFKQDGMRQKAAGQWEEHEKASTTSPLLYSYQEGDTLEKCSVRLGREYCEMSGFTKWCSPFRMLSDTGAIRLFSHHRDGRPDQEFQIGVEIHRGRGQYQNTRVVTFVAKFQLENRTQYCLAYLQRHEQKHKPRNELPLLRPGAIASFHWPRTDLDQLLILKVEDISTCQWSGGFHLNRDHSFHIHMRGTSGHSIFVRCDVSLKGATHHVVFSDAALFPAPFRLENLSQIGVSYKQLNTIIPPSLLNPGQSVPYAWDDITQPEKICLQVQGTLEEQEFDLVRLGERGMLYYESYFYIAATATFPGRSLDSSTMRNRGTEANELVLDVPQGTAVILQKKNPERRSQLWRMTSSRQLVHISSSAHYDRDMVLGLAGRLPPRGQFTTLNVEKKKESKQDRQTWRFTEDGRLLLDTAQHLCVQSPMEHLSLREGVDAVLGHTSKTNEGGVPHEQQLRRYKHSPGSGRLAVEVLLDGPTRILRIRDQNEKYTHTAPQDNWAVADYGQVAPPRSSDVDSNGEQQEGEEEEDNGAIELDFSLTLEHGIGLSLINSVPEELVFGSLDGVHLQFMSSKHQQCVNLTIQNLQVDNQLSNSHTPILAYPTPPSSSSQSQTFSYPVIKLFVERIPHKSPFATVFKEVEVKVRDITLLLEERLLFKLLQWAGIGGKRMWFLVGTKRGGSEEEEEEEVMRMLSNRSAILSSGQSVPRQLYIENFIISETELRVSMYTTSQLPDDLMQIKKRLILPLVKFESPIFLSGFNHSHMLNSPAAFADALTKHYKKAIRNQALMILGSVDFLGNPVGLVSDVAAGVAGMIDSQDVVGLVRDVTHGMSDTTSKLTGTVSHVLGQATFDSSFQEEREQVQEQCHTSGDHLRAGIIGLGSGVFGGMTSIFTQPYRGVVESGVEGFFTGLGKGLLGTVAKPAAGIFDFASGTTAALRETMSRVSKLHPPPVRIRRCCIGSTGTLTCYSESQARGQEYLLRLNDGATDERLVSYELLNQSYSDTMRLIVSSRTLYFFRESPPDRDSLVERIELFDLQECRSSSVKTTLPAYFIILSLVDLYKMNDYGRRAQTKFCCSNKDTAQKVTQLINYAKNLHEEEKRIVRTLRLQQDTIW